MGKLVLAGDVGGTNTRLALFEIPAGGVADRLPEPTTLERFKSASPGGLSAIARQFLDATGARPAAICFGVAGPVVTGHVKAPNLPFEVDGMELQHALGAPVALLNDLEAAAHGVLHLGPAQLRTLQVGQLDPNGVVALIAAGTGLGEAALVLVNGVRRAIPTEGGHADFGPIDEEQVALLRSLWRTHGRVSYERILSGAGIARIYGHLSGGESLEPAQISERALAASDDVAVKTLRLFARIYGAEAGNVALRTLAFGGLYVTGGIAPKILPFLEEGGFLAAFRAKGRASAIVERVPVHVAIDEIGPLLGAASVAATI